MKKTKEDTNTYKGLVIRNTGSWYIVRNNENEDFQCKLRGNFRLKGIRSTNPISIGDWVQYILLPDGTGLISKIEPRKNYIIRKSSNLSKDSHIIAANIDLCFLVITVKYPETSTTFIDRFLASAEAYNVPVCIIINKCDIYDKDDMMYLEGLKSLYEYIGYQCVKTSCVTKEGVEKIRELIQGKTVLFSGHSGVGKSTLINTIVPNISLRTALISSAHKQGIHTTTFSEMVSLPHGGYLIDTPGIKGFGTFDMDKNEISHYFKEIFQLSKNCKYNNCKHLSEPQCAVIQALEDHGISQSRYTSYISMMNDESEEKYR